jgi:hypothetical protein
MCSKQLISFMGVFDESGHTRDAVHGYSLGTRAVILCLSLFLLIGCSRWATEENRLLSEAVTPLPRLKAEPLPEFLEWVYPKPGTAWTMEAFVQEAWIWFIPGETVLEPAICISFLTFALFEPGDDLTVEEALNRLSVEVDGIVFTDLGDHLLSDDFPLLPRDPQTGAPSARFEGGSIILACFPVEIDPGLHTASFVARKSSGNELRYTWSFILVETPQEAPEYRRRPYSLSSTEPAPGAVIPIDQYKSGRRTDDVDLLDPNVCIRIIAYNLSSELGTEPSLEALAPLSYLLLNGELVHEKVARDVYGGQLYYDFCFPADLETGLHTATFVMRDAYENTLEYTWYFVLVE